jgi:hypothetical protein
LKNLVLMSDTPSFNSDQFGHYKHIKQ